MAAAAILDSPTNESATAGSFSEDSREYSKGLSSADWIAFLTLMAVYGVMGVVGNSLLLAVFVRRLRRAASGGGGRMQRQGQQYNYFTAALALADLFVCAVVVPYKAAYSSRIIFDDDACKVMQYMVGVSLIFSVLVLGGIAVERYHAVCRPTRPFTRRHAWTIIGIITTLALFCSFPNCLASSVRAADGRLVGCHFMSGTQHGRTFAATLTALFFGTLVVIFVLYGLVFRVIYRRKSGSHPGTAAGDGPCGKVYQPQSSQSRSTGTRGTDSDAELGLNDETLRQDESNGVELKPATLTHASRSSRRSQSTTRVVWMLFGVTFVFFISWVPNFLTNLHVVPYSLAFQYVYFINNCTNFIVYGICNRKIRKEMIDRLLCR